MSDIPELTDKQFNQTVAASRRKRLIEGHFDSGEDIVALRTFVGLTQAEFARALEISIHTLRNWEQGRRKPEGPAVALLRIAASAPQPVPSAPPVARPRSSTMQQLSRVAERSPRHLFHGSHPRIIRESLPSVA